ncbi:hypothetical protein Pelo_2102 [Pelomyxa schiedti]|nr:hypothetical protein Pelo_2102 [Pelomyxa schiedti]
MSVGFVVADCAVMSAVNVAMYPLLPRDIPVHFDWRLRPDWVTHKAVLFGALDLGFVLLVALLWYWIPHKIRESRGRWAQPMKIPDRDWWAQNPRRQEAAKLAMIKRMRLLGAAGGLWMASLLALSASYQFGVGPGWIVAAAVVWLAFVLWWAISLNPHLKKLRRELERDENN